MGKDRAIIAFRPLPHLIALAGERAPVHGRRTARGRAPSQDERSEAQHVPDRHLIDVRAETEAAALRKGLPGLRPASRVSASKEVLAELLELRVKRGSLPLDPGTRLLELDQSRSRRQVDVVVGERVGPENAKDDRRRDQEPLQWTAARQQRNRAKHCGKQHRGRDDHERLRVNPR